MPIEHTLCPTRRSRFVSQSPIYYGWIILFAGTLGLIMTSPGQTYSVSVFVEYFITDLDISRSLVSTLFAIGPLAGSLALPIIGRHVDKRGSRLMVVVIATVLGVACIYMSFVQGAVMLCWGFVALRTFGKGGLELVSYNVINQWWVRRRGMAMGIAGFGMSLLGIGASPSLVGWLIPIYGWRSTYIILGLMLLLVMVPLGFLLLRDHPEDYGLKPDGHIMPEAHAPKGGDDDATEAPQEENWTAQEAIRTPAFWIFALSIGFIMMQGAGLFFHMVSICQDNGLNATVAAAVFAPIGLITAIVNLSSGILVDRMPVRALLVMALVLLTLTLVMAQFMRSVAFVTAYGILLGVTIGLMRTIRGVIWATYFGRRHLGSITGITSTILVAGSALGPVPLGVARDMLGSYNTALAVTAIIPLVLAVASFLVKQPQRSQ